MPPAAVIAKSISLRARLLRRIFFRGWKSVVLANAGSLVREIKYEHESEERQFSFGPAIILCDCRRLYDFVVLAYLFLQKDLTVIAPRNLPNERVIRISKAINHVIYLDVPVGFRFFKRVMTILRDFNRSIVIPPQAAERFASEVPIDPSMVVRMAMMANVPILPLKLSWLDTNGKYGTKGCTIWMGRRLYISPANPDFKDVFFKRRGVRQFKKLPQQDLAEIGRRIFNKIK